METLVKGYKKSTAVDMVSQASKAVTAASKKLESAIVILELKGQDIAKWKGVDFKGAKMTFIDSKNVGKIELHTVSKDHDAEDENNDDPSRKEEIFGHGNHENKITAGKPAAGKYSPTKTTAGKADTKKHEVTFPAGFEKGTKVKFEAAGTSATPGAKLTGVVKNIFWDKQSQTEYFTIESGGKLYTKRPANVVLATVKGKK